jgi:hypothetical protein
MFSSTNLWLAITVIAILMVCYILILFKLKPSNEPADRSISSEPFQDIPENFSPTRRTELLEKIKEERIMEYLGKRKRK